ncbi:MAG TPA: hypothetical protein VH092_35815 [Urbifossiella sp.]|jgi:hypothetical protein|nr:hypothetical protein [Urbifossiella sp.]
MLTLRKCLFAAAVALAAAPGVASAQNMHGSPFMSQPHAPHFGPYLFANSHNRQLPAFQAAPWYLYWPYDAHFMTPAPIHAPFYGPPTGGNFPVNPYFPSPAGYYGPYPGGPAPGGVGPAPLAPGAIPVAPGAAPLPAIPSVPPAPAGIPVRQ